MLVVWGGWGERLMDSVNERQHYGANAVWGVTSVMWHETWGIDE